MAIKSIFADSFKFKRRSVPSKSSEEELFCFDEIAEPPPETALHSGLSVLNLLRNHVPDSRRSLSAQFPFGLALVCKEAELSFLL